MRHLKSGRKLGRTASHRKALMRNLAAELFLHKTIKTTTAKAKELRSLAERLITFAKKGDLAARRQVLRFVKNKSIVTTLFDEIAKKYTDRNGGYMRIVKLGARRGDGAPLSIVELVGYEGIQTEKLEKQRQKREAKAKAKEEAEKKEKEAGSSESAAE